MSVSSFEFGTCSKVVFGVNTLEKALVQARAAGALRTKALVVCVSPERAKSLLDLLAAKFKLPFVTFSVAGEPTTEDVDRIIDFARAHHVDCVISLGGGSVLDMGKAAAVLLANDGHCLDYMEVIGKGKPLLRPGLPHIAIPTTAGTGAEVTKNAVIKSEAHKQKASLRSDHMYPSLAIVDPALCLSVSPAVTGATGMDAFTQCLEPFTSCSANPLTDAIARAGLRCGALSLRTAYQHPSDIAARTNMSLCSLFGGLALANAKLGSVHGFAGVLGGVLPNAPHGGICGALLAACTATNAKALQQREPRNPALAKYQDAAAVVLGRPASVRELAEWIAETCAILEIRPLSAYGLRPEDFSDVITKSLASSSMKGNPIVLTAMECNSILRQACLPTLLDREHL